MNDLSVPSVVFKQRDAFDYVCPSMEGRQTGLILPAWHHDDRTAIVCSIITQLTPEEGIGFSITRDWEIPYEAAGCGLKFSEERDDTISEKRDAKMAKLWYRILLPPRKKKSHITVGSKLLEFISFI
ncbi:hypothetical protein WN51_13175 [Melipona quadrifasciata]|uniref:Uncharacterized protein n=1 Tax=Melipona quadrifasciata TaxID=166423 RepID=A0A0M9A0C3_9HYME|nr:hypothetical protein WN51_13175 [Melipona quadrifasciata]